MYWSRRWEAFWIPVAKVPSLASGGIQQLELTRCPGTAFLDFESTRTGLRLHLFILSASITSIVEHFSWKKGAARARNYEVIRRWSGGILGGDREVIGGDQRWSAIWVPFFCMAGTAFQLFEEPEKVGEQTPNIILEVGRRCSTSTKSRMCHLQKSRRFLALS